MRVLIADSGSTKTSWYYAGDGNEYFCQTSGINPFYQNENAIMEVLRNEFTIRVGSSPVIFFYGAGCGNPHSKSIVEGALHRFFNSASLEVESDLMAAARSLCQYGDGIACIVGTGSNACFYNGTEIIQYVPSMGYILGDEGSGADLGRRLVSDIFKKQLPSSVSERFFEYYHYTSDQIQEHVYKQAFPNRFLAQFTPFLLENIGEASVRTIVKGSFNKFFVRNIKQYPMAKEYPIDFTGSIAFHFREILNESAADNGFRIGKIEKDPMPGLIQYHKRG
jgi:N-acetylglucosamine kinase-like BadF-type ATPase